MTGTGTQVALSLEAVPTSVRDARYAVADALTSAGWPVRAIDEVRLCVSEAVANVVRHAYAGSGMLRLVIERRDGELLVGVRRGGGGFPQAAVEEGKEGGFGLKIIERLATRVELTSAPGAGTSIVMVFAVPREVRRGAS